MKKCYIAGAGEDYGTKINVEEGSYVIAADAGIRLLRRQNIPPDLMIGDFDSFGDIPQGSNVIVMPTEKDDTDMIAAVKEGIKAGCDEFHLYGGMGGRFDHTMANIQTLAYLAERGMQGYLYGKESIITIIKDGKMEFDKKYCGYISVFSYSQKSENVTISGLKYEIENAVLHNSFPLGVSNEFTGRSSKIEVGDGMLLIVFPYME